MHRPTYERLRAWQIATALLAPIPAVVLLFLDVHVAWLLMAATLGVQAAVESLRWTPKRPEHANHLMPYLPPAWKPIVPRCMPVQVMPRPESVGEAIQRWWALLRPLLTYVRQPSSMLLPALEERAMQRAEAVLQGYAKRRQHFTPRMALEALRLRLATCQREEFWAIVYDDHVPTRGSCIGILKICVGTSNEILSKQVKRELHKVLGDSVAESVVLVHNHPSGYPMLSDGDKESIAWLSKMFGGVDIRCYHAVVGSMGVSPIYNQWGCESHL